MTGGASGLGRAAAEEIVSAGGRAVVVDVNAETGKAAESALAGRVRGSPRPTSRARSRSRPRSSSPSAPSAACTAWSTPRASDRRPRSSARTARTRWILFEKTIRVNLVGTFNVIRLAAAAMAQNTPDAKRRARRHHQHRVDCGVRRSDRPAGLRRIEGRHRRADAARSRANSRRSAFASSPSRPASSIRRRQVGLGFFAVSLAAFVFGCGWGAWVVLLAKEVASRP